MRFYVPLPQFRQRVRLLPIALLATAVSVIALAIAAGSASAETLTLDPAHAAACPACMTDDGGARVVNLFENIAGATGKSVTYSGPVSGFDYAADAGRIFSNYTNLDAGSATMTSTQAASADVAGGVSETAEVAGVLPEVEGAAGLGSLTIPPVAAGVVVVVGTVAVGFGAHWLIEKLFGGTSNSTSGTYTSPTGVSIPAPATWTSGLFGEVPFSSNTAMASFCGRGCWQFQMFGGSTTSWQTQGGYCTDQTASTDPRHYFVDHLLSATGFLVFSSSAGSCSTWGMNTYVGLANASTLQRSGAEVADAAPSGAVTLQPVATVPSRVSLADAISNAINSGGTTLPKWLQSQLDPRCSADPTSPTVAIPEPDDSESGGDYLSCLEHLGLSVTTDVLPDSEQDVSDDGVVDVSPDVGAEVDASATPVTVVKNPPYRTGTQPNDKCIPEGGGLPGDNPGDAPADGTQTPEFQPPPAGVTSDYPAYDPRDPSHPDLTILLRWGREESKPRWGWQHIVTEHGYTGVDAAATQDALVTGAATEEAPSTDLWLYRTTYDVRSDSGDLIHCARSVWVQFKKLDNEPAARFIQNSYAGELIPGS